MNEPQSERLSRGQLYEEAAAWVAKMHGPDAEEHRPEFEAWLKRGALHRASYNLATEIYMMGDLLDDEPDLPGQELVLERNPKRRWPLLLAAVALAAVAASWTALRPAEIIGNARSGDALRRTEVAQIAAITTARDLRLVDGSLVRLVAGAQLDVAYDGAIRRLVLEKGGARFQVAHEARPFVVYAGGGSVTAHGTIFDVGLSKSRQVSVRLIQGMIDVALPTGGNGAQAAAIRQMHQGEIVRFSAGPEAASQQRYLATFHPGPDFPTIDGAHDYDRIRLSDLIADANSNASRPILVTDPSIGNLRISGLFRINDPDLLAERVAALFDLTIDRSNPAMIILKRK